MSHVTAELARLARQRLAELEAEASILRSVVACYDGELGDDAGPQTALRRPSADQGAAKARRLTNDWLDILSFIVGQPGTVHLDAIEAYSKRKGYPHTRDRLRSQMHNWKVRKLVESPAQSVFAVTEAGRAELVDSNAEGADEPPAPSTEIESSDERQDAKPETFPLLNSSPAYADGG